jgi:hypothetical protein
MSGRACAAVVPNMATPRVAASATAILNDIGLSTFTYLAPFGGQIPSTARKTAGFAHAFLTACVNQKLSMRAPARIFERGAKEMFETK